MTIALITPRRPACYGMGCPRHQDCQRYAAVEETSPDHTMATCDERGAKNWPLFVRIEVKESVNA